MRRTNIFLPVPMIEELHKLSAQQDISLAEIIRRAVTAYIAMNKEKA